jgi:hypothetical protein
LDSGSCIADWPMALVNRGDAEDGWAKAFIVYYGQYVLQDCWALPR